MADFDYRVFGFREARSRSCYHFTIPILPGEMILDEKDGEEMELVSTSGHSLVVVGDFSSIGTSEFILT